MVYSQGVVCDEIKSSTFFHWIDSEVNATEMGSIRRAVQKFTSSAFIASNNDVTSRTTSTY